MTNNKTMKFLLLSLLTIFCLNLFGQSKFDELFTGETLRLDYVLAGNNAESKAYFHKLSKELHWPGSRSGHNEPYINGNYYFEIFGLKPDSVIYRKSFNSLFGEWQTTLEAEYMFRAFQQTAYFPCPKDTVLFRLYKRKNRNISVKLMEVKVDPGNFLIPIKTAIPVYTNVLYNGEPDKKADLLFIAEGYTPEEKEKFISDVHRFTEYLFGLDPFKEKKDKFNIRALHSFSSESGTDNPGTSRWVETPASTGFYTFGSERYLTSSEYWKICDLIENVPHDHILILVNTDKYGGGGIYNHYSIFTSDHPLSEIVFVHEFGHGFAGLGDEYYDSEVAYNNFYPPDAEPLPPNLTTLVNFESKWKNMLSPGIPVPTPAIKKYKDKTGVFEGGGYVAKGVYRPQQTCRMKSNDARSFCRVCRKSLSQMTDHYSE